MSKKFGKHREVDPYYLNVPIKYILNYTGKNEDGKDHYRDGIKIKEAKDKTLTIVDIYGKNALVAWRNNKTYKMGMTKLCPLIWKYGKLYLKYKDTLIQLSDTSGWVI